MSFSLLLLFIVNCCFLFFAEVTFVRIGTNSISPTNLNDPDSPTGMFDNRHSSFTFANIGGARKKPAPKPPHQALPQQQLDNFSYDNRIYPKMSSFQPAEQQLNNNDEYEHVTVSAPQPTLQPPTMPAVPPSVITSNNNNNSSQPQFANIRRGNMASRMGGAINSATGKTRPSSFYERPMVPPPEVPPRPTIIPRNGHDTERVETPELLLNVSPEPGHRSSMYPNLKDMPEYEELSGTDSNDLDDYSGEDSCTGIASPPPPPPQKPPRLANNAATAAGGQDNSNLPQQQQNSSVNSMNTTERHKDHGHQQTTNLPLTLSDENTNL